MQFCLQIDQKRQPPASKGADIRMLQRSCSALLIMSFEIIVILTETAQFYNNQFAFKLNAPTRPLSIMRCCESSTGP
jgi:hypothetical protein